MCALLTVWTCKALDVNTNLGNFILCAYSSAFLIENINSATLPLQHTFWLKMQLQLLCYTDRIAGTQENADIFFAGPKRLCVCITTPVILQILVVQNE